MANAINNNMLALLKGADGRDGADDTARAENGRTAPSRVRKQGKHAYPRKIHALTGTRDNASAYG